MTLVTPVFLTFATILWIYFLWSRRKYYALALKMPGLYGLPLIGILHRLSKMEDILFELPKLVLENKTKTTLVWYGPYPLIYTVEPKIAEFFLKSPDFIKKSIIYEAFQDLLGDGLLTSKPEIWHVHRKLLNPAFSYKVLLNFIPHFNTLSRELCEKLGEAVGLGEVNVKELAFSLALKSAVETNMGSEFSNKSVSALSKDFDVAQSATISRILKPWLNMSFIFERTNIYKQFKKSQANMLKFFRELVIRKIELVKEDDRAAKKQGPSFVEESVDIKRESHIFIDEAIKIHQRDEFTIDEIVAETNIIISGATETTANSLFSVLMYLAMFPQYQKRVFEEVDALNLDEQFNVTYEDIKTLTFLDMCINETLRMSPGIPLIGRECTKDVSSPEGLVIPKGTQVLIDIFNIHREKDIWGPTADTFDPDHFLPTNVAKRSNYAFLPFSKGPRNCIGWQYATMLLKVALVQILRKYRFATKYKFKDLKYLECVTLKYKTLPYLEIQKR